VLISSCSAISSSGLIKRHKQGVRQGVLQQVYGKDDWKREEKSFAEGAFGRVYHATGGKDEKVVIKMVKVVDSAPKDREMTEAAVKQEIAFQQAVAAACPGAAEKIYDSWIEDGHDGKYYAIVMEPLMDIPKLAGAMASPVARLESLGIEFMTKLLCMNKARYMHNDLKVDNMMAKPGSEFGPVRIVDFGKCTRMGDAMDADLVERRPRLITTLMQLIYGMQFFDLLKVDTVVAADAQALKIATEYKPFTKAVTDAIDAKFGALGAAHWAWINGLHQLQLKKSEAIAAAMAAIASAHATK